MVRLSREIPKGTKARILDAANEVFVRRGTEGARMEEIARVAGVNKPLLYYHFKSKDELAKAVWLRIATRFGPRILELMASDASIEEKIDGFVEAYLTGLTPHPYLSAYVISEASRHPEFVAAFYGSGRQRLSRQMLKRLRTQIAEEVKAKRMAPISAEQFFLTLVGACVYPFVARPMLTAAFGIGPKAFDALMKRRRKVLPVFLKRALRP